MPDSDEHTTREVIHPALPDITSKETNRNISGAASTTWPVDTIPWQVIEAVHSSIGYRARTGEVTIVNAAMTAGHPSLHILAPHATGTTTASHVIIACKTFLSVPPSTNPNSRPPGTIYVSDTRQSVQQAYTSVKAIFGHIDKNLTLALWQGVSRGKDEKEFQDPLSGDAIFATTGKIKQKMQRGQIDVSRLHTVIFDNSSNLFGSTFAEQMETGIFTAIRKARLMGNNVQVIVNSSPQPPAFDFRRMLESITANTYMTLHVTSGGPGTGAAAMISSDLKFVELPRGENLLEFGLKLVSDFLREYQTTRRLLLMLDTQVRTQNMFWKIREDCPGMTDQQFSDRIGMYHGGFEQPGSLFRGTAGLDDFNDPYSHMLVLVTSPLTSSIIVRGATDVLILKTADDILDDAAARWLSACSRIGRNGETGRVTTVLSGVHDMAMARDIKALLEENGMPVPGTLTSVLEMGE